MLEWLNLHLHKTPPSESSSDGKKHLLNRNHLPALSLCLIIQITLLLRSGHRLAGFVFGLGFECCVIGCWACGGQSKW